LGTGQNAMGQNANLKERRKIKVYKELKPYIEAHEKMKKMKENQ
jgi:hypothetical protein